MIRGILIILTMAGVSSFAAGINQNASVTLAWTPSSSPDISGYDIYYGTASSNYTGSITVSNVAEVTIQGLTNGATYYIAVKTLNSSGILSAFSPQISYVAGTTSAIPGVITSQLASPSGQFSFMVSGTSGFEYAVETSTNLVNWAVLGLNTVPFNFVDTNANQFSRRFYRAVPASDVIFTLPPAAGLITSNLVNTSGQFSFTVMGTGSYPYAVEASTNLVNWIILATNNAPFIFVDTNASQFNRRFYRAVPAPDAGITATAVTAAPTTPTAAAAGLITSNFVNAPGQYSFTVTGTVGDPYAVEASTNLVNWIILATNNVPFSFVDTNASQFSRRFYRAVPAPDAGITAVAVTTATVTAAAGIITSTTVNTSGQFSFTVTGTAGDLYAVEASTNLANWIMLAKAPVPYNFVDGNANQFGQRFYRAVYFPK